MNRYKDIINLPHPEPKNRLRMPRFKRAAQFAPFAALTGYEESIKKAADSINDEVIPHVNECFFSEE